MIALFSGSHFQCSQQGAASERRSDLRHLAHRRQAIEPRPAAPEGLDILAGLPDDAAREELELDLQIALGHALDTTKGLAALEAGETYARAPAL